MIILTMLGTGNYGTTRYVWGDRTCETHLFPIALATWFPEAEVKALATVEASEKFGGPLQDAVPRADLVPIPSGKSESELWEIYRTISETLPDGSPVLFDITHGFRSLPTLALLALSFLRTAKKVRLEHVLYGAWEARDPETNASPVFELTPFVTMIDWANATNRFLETGQAQKFAPLITKNERYALKEVAGRMTDVSDALAHMRAQAVTDSAQKLLNRITAARSTEWDQKHAPMQLLLDLIEEQFSPMSNRDPLKAQWAEIVWLADRKHYAAAASLAREWLVSVRVLTSGERILPVVDASRDAAEKWLNDRTKAVPAEWTRALELWRNLGNLRNDLMHWGMREGPRPVGTVEREVNALPEQLRLAVAPLGLEVGP
jgi:CRISPR-associated Csx2 family protein